MTSSLRNQHLPVIAALAAALVVPAGAAANPTVTLDRACYSPGERITEAGSGFTPGAGVVEALGLFSAGGRDAFGSLLAPPVTADAQGAFVRRIPAPRLARRADRRELAVAEFTDQANPEAEPATVSWWLTAWEVDIKQWDAGRAKPGRTMVVDTYGWTSAGTTLYAHYFRGRTRVKSVKLGALRGDCGDMRKRVIQFPFRRPRRGIWTVYFSATRTLDKRADAWIARVVRVP